MPHKTLSAPQPNSLRSLCTEQIITAASSTQKMGRQHSFPFLVAILTYLFTSSLSNAAHYNVLYYGAKPDGRTDSTKAFLAAWIQACGSVTPATVYVPAGRFFLRNIVFQGPCKNGAILFRIVGTLVAPSDYRVIGNAGNWLLFQFVNGVTVYGGVLDGQGPALWACKASGRNCPTGATVSYFRKLIKNFKGQWSD